MFANLLSYIFLLGSTLANNTSQPYSSPEIPYIACVNEDQITSSNVWTDDLHNLYSFNQDDKINITKIVGHPYANTSFHNPGRYLCLYQLTNQSMRYHRWIVSSKTKKIPQKYSSKYVDPSTILIVIGETLVLIGLQVFVGLSAATCKSVSYRKKVDKVKQALIDTEYEKIYQKKYLYDLPIKPFCSVFCEKLKHPCNRVPKKGVITINDIPYQGFYPDKHDLRLTIPYPKEVQRKLINIAGYVKQFPVQGGSSTQENYMLRIKDFTPPKNNVQGAIGDNATEALTDTPYIIPNLPNNKCFICPYLCCCVPRNKRRLHRASKRYLNMKQAYNEALPLPFDLSVEDKKELYETLAFDQTFLDKFVGSVDVIIQYKPEKKRV